MRTKLSIAVAASLFALLGSTLPASAADLVWVSGPGGPFVGYTLPVLVAAQGDNVTYINLDPFEHDVHACPNPNSCDPRNLQPAGQEASWCTEPIRPGEEPPFPDPGTCPLFWTPLIGIGGQEPIYGMDLIAPGESYTFFCSIHANMDATLVVLP